MFSTHDTLLIYCFLFCSLCHFMENNFQITSLSTQVVQTQVTLSWLAVSCLLLHVILLISCPSSKWLPLLHLQRIFFCIYCFFSSNLVIIGLFYLKIPIWFGTWSTKLPDQSRQLSTLHSFSKFNKLKIKYNNACPSKALFVWGTYVHIGYSMQFFNDFPNSYNIKG